MTLHTLASVQERIATLKKQQDDFVTQANLALARLDGAIAVWQEILTEMEKESEAATPQPAEE